MNENEQVSNFSVVYHDYECRNSATITQIMNEKIQLIHNHSTYYCTKQNFFRNGFANLKIGDKVQLDIIHETPSRILKTTAIMIGLLRERFIFILFLFYRSQTGSS